MEQIRKEGETIRQEVSELSATNLLLKKQTETLTGDKEKLLSENEKLEKQQKRLQQELNKMAQSKEVMEKNIHAYDADVKWQLAELGALMSAKVYRDKKALPLVEKLFVSMESMLPLIFFKMTQATYGCPIMIRIKKKLLLLQMGMNGNPMPMQLLH